MSLHNYNSGNVIYLLNKPGVRDDYFYDLKSWRNEISRPYIQLREIIEKAGFQFKITHDCADLDGIAALLSFCYVDHAILNNISKIPRNRCLLLVPEPPSLLPHLYHPILKNYFGSIIVLLDEVVDNHCYFKFHHPHYRVLPEIDVPHFSQKKLGVMVHSNLRSDHPRDLYAERHRLARFFSSTNDVELFGGGWDEYPIWKGCTPDDKITFLKNYKFYFAYENTTLAGYITERIFDAFFGGCVPIYWGAPNITDYVPKECFIDRRQFSSNDELYRFMKSMDCQTYESYLEAGRAFLKTPQAELFSPTNFAQTILKHIQRTINQQ